MTEASSGETDRTGSYSAPHIREHDRKVMKFLRSWPFRRLAIQILIVICFLAAWEYLPRIDFLAENFRVLNPFVISSPSQLIPILRDLVVGGPLALGIELLPFLQYTVTGTVIGTAIGLLLGLILGVVFSQSDKLNEVAQPFVVLMNTIPRVALIPIFIIIARPTLNAEILSVIGVVGFLAFFNALEGGRSVKQSVLDNAGLLGASPMDIMLSVRLPVAIEWTFAVLPNAISFGLVIAVTAELLAGLRGIGQLLLISMTNLRADLTFAVILVLSLLGMILYAAGKVLHRLVVRW